MSSDSDVRDVRTFCCRNLKIFRKIWDIRTDKRREGVEVVRIIFGQERRESIFCNFL